MATIPFDELVPGATVRVCHIEEAQYFCITDLIATLSGKTRRRASEVMQRMTVRKTASKTWNRLSSKAEIYSEIMDSCKQYKFKGQGERFQAVINIEGAMKLIMVLPGETAKAMRVQVADILSRYVNGSESLINEIKHNKQIGPMAACSNMAQKAVAKASQFTEMPQVSYVYCTKSEAFPDLVKIGRSVDIGARLSTLNTGCAPAPHFIVAVAPTFNAPRDEALAHTFFASARREGEFFQVTPEEVKTFFANHIMAQYQVELAEHVAKAQGDIF
jgi:hypothetical protein